MASPKLRYNDSSGEMEEIIKNILYPGTDIYTQAQELDDGSWNYIEPSSRESITSGKYYYDPQYTEAQGEGITGGGAQRATGKYNTLQQNLFSNVLGDLAAFQPGTILSQEEVAQMLPLLMNPEYIKGAPKSPEEYFNDPRSAIKIKDGKFVWQPDEAKGDWESTIGGNIGIGNRFRDWISSPSVQVMASALGGGGLSSFANVIGQAASTATDNPIYKQLTGLLNLANGVYNNWDSISSAIDNFSLEDLNPFGGDGAISGEYTDTYSPGSSSNSFVDTGNSFVNTGGAATPGGIDLSKPWTVDDLINKISQGGEAFSGNLPITDSMLGLPVGGLTSILQGTGQTISGPFGDLTLDPSGSLVKTGVNLGNSTQTNVPGMGSDVTSQLTFWDKMAKLTGIDAATLSKAAETTPFLSSVIRLVSALNGESTDEEALGWLKDAYGKVDPFAGERPFYQQMLRQSYTNPDFFSNNPVFQGIRNTAINDVGRQAAARGFNNSTNVLHNIASRINDEGLKYGLTFQGQLANNAGAGISPAAAAAVANQGANLTKQTGDQQSFDWGNFVSSLPKTIDQVSSVFKTGP